MNLSINTNYSPVSFKANPTLKSVSRFRQAIEQQVPHIMTQIAFLPAAATAVMHSGHDLNTIKGIAMAKLLVDIPEAGARLIGQFLLNKPSHVMAKNPAASAFFRIGTAQQISSPIAWLVDLGRIGIKKGQKLFNGN